MDIASPCWTQYLAETLVTWSSYPTTKADGIFFDVGFPPWYNYSPANWWTVPAGGASRQALDAWWNPRAKTYFDGLRTAFAPPTDWPELVSDYGRSGNAERPEQRGHDEDATEMHRGDDDRATRGHHSQGI